MTVLKQKKGSKMELEQIAETKNSSVTKTGPKEPTLSLAWNEDGALTLGLQGDFSKLQSAGSDILVAGLLSQIAVLGSHGERADENASNFVLSFVDSMEPRDATETLLCTQMAAVHQATMMMARRLNHVENIPQQDAAERALNKLARTFAAQMEALRKHRNGGKQTVTVQHVNVEHGGQAIVGHVQSGGGSDGL